MGSGVNTVKRVLMIAFHYPPCRGSSGLQRTLSFSHYLPNCDWDPLILTVQSRAHQELGEDQLRDIPATVPVARAFALDTARHLGVRGRHFKWMALPDRWVSWCLGAIPKGLHLIRTYKPQVLWSTYPIATSHLIGLSLHRLTRIPWVADFRDPMTELNPVTQQRAPQDSSLWRARSWIESHTVKSCARAVFTTQGAQRIYAERYPEAPSSRWGIIANGYNEEHFIEAEARVTERSSEKGPIVLLHSGTLYPTPDRDPSAFFSALAMLKCEHQLSAASLQVVLRASGYSEHYRHLVHQHGVDDIVALKPAIPYRDALAEMLSADGLLLFQGYTSNPAIPAKFYEYLRAKRPIFAMVAPDGDTAKALESAQAGALAPLDSSTLIAQRLLDFLQHLRQGQARVASPNEVRRHSREVRTQELASLLNAVSN